MSAYVSNLMKLSMEELTTATELEACLWAGNALLLSNSNNESIVERERLALYTEQEELPLYWKLYPKADV